MRQLRRLVRQDVADNQRLQLAEQAGADAVFRHIFAENDERPDFAARFHWQSPARFAPNSAEQIPVSLAPLLFGFRSALNSSLSPSPRARNGIGDRAKFGCKFLEQIKFFVRLPGGGDDRHRTLRRLASNGLKISFDDGCPGPSACPFRVSDFVSAGPRG